MSLVLTTLKMKLFLTVMAYKSGLHSPELSEAEILLIASAITGDPAPCALSVRIQNISKCQISIV